LSPVAKISQPLAESISHCFTTISFAKTLGIKEKAGPMLRDDMGVKIDDSKKR
jgi:hypothetical protein